MAAKTKSKVLSNADKWDEMADKLRTLLLDCGLDEETKWGKPCFTFEGHNIVVVQGFKDYFAVLFLKGLLLKDPEGVLVKTGENTRVGRQMRFENEKEIVKMKTIIKSYIYEAIELERAGLKIDAPTKPNSIPEELQNKFKKHPAFKSAFNSLTPGRQRAYVYHFSAPKQSKTREARIEKYVPQILDGVGLNDDFIAKKKK
jgi:uncharacterized protein YdeI (YjbR/CyaY-like superfamily)